MIWSSARLRGRKLRATDGALGDVADFLFSDEGWTVRYLVADTRGLTGRKVLIAAEALGAPAIDRQGLAVALTRQKVKESPSVEASPGISPREEALLHEYFGWSPHWGGQAVPLAGFEAGIVPPGGFSEHVAVRGAIHLHSMEEVEGYAVEASDGPLGHVDDFLVDDQWRIRYLGINTEKRLPAKETVVAVDWLRGIEWGRRTVAVALSRAEMRESPPYSPELSMARDYEARLYAHYHRPAYW